MVSRFILPVAALSSAGLASAVQNQKRRLHCDYSPRNTPKLPPSLRIKDKDFILVAAGTRKVTFLSISVYDVGIYISSSDIPHLNAALRSIQVDSPTALIEHLKDPVDGASFLNALDNVSYAVRITPVRNTDIAHMRDGFVRGVLLRHNPDAESLQSFKDFFPNPRKAFLKTDVMLLTVWNGQRLDLDINGHDYGTYQGFGVETSNLLKAFIGTYTSGKKVASEELRQEFVEQIVQEVQ
ncbi:Uncharacterized protein C18G6.01c [Taphrina deformans PYCC 5710]|uniref:Uncharacterized protein C18G6.01c n=1 Tax=Taphrina deformans (strain PYCC 5710 / ATCC 11124 / CBS 356.35 / IMI 108563 / JCM 9778 / NBRC 8474) TaxID=1097556 RepID=R4XDH2_TAPDE|nr:Uncharacterized protein C18G6.01c [Taphrina deformans PYCC 5710]|eukprot:CCG82458.1 Uncharacterized protein C18G6.01c [Taphrina deformans PYCC 5710]